MVTEHIEEVVIGVVMLINNPGDSGDNKKQVTRTTAVS